jgi:hypothetical protein
MTAIGRAGLAVTAVAVVLIGLWWTPSVQGTIRVLLGHTESLERFAVAGDVGDATVPTLRDAAPAVGSAVTSGPRELLLGLGPGNSTSHAAEVLAQGAKNGVSLPAPGPLALDLLSDADDIKFRDAQSTVLGLWGDLGTVGSIAYAATCLTCLYALVVPAGLRRAIRSPRCWAIPLLAAGVLAGGTLLDWPEQASVVIPVALALLVLAGNSAPAGPASPGGERRLRVGGRVPAATS